MALLKLTWHRYKIASNNYWLLIHFNLTWETYKLKRNLKNKTIFKKIILWISFYVSNTLWCIFKDKHIVSSRGCHKVGLKATQSFLSFSLYSHGVVSGCFMPLHLSEHLLTHCSFLPHFGLRGLSGTQDEYLTCRVSPGSLAWVTDTPLPQFLNCESSVD